MDKQRRREASREYRDAPREMGVYRVSCAKRGLAVVGTSPDLRSILNRHRAQLDLGGHPDRSLQSAWDALGADAFLFEVLDTLEPGDDPAYDPTRDLEELGELWRERLAKG